MKKYYSWLITGVFLVGVVILIFIIYPKFNHNLKRSNFEFISKITVYSFSLGKPITVIKDRKQINDICKFMIACRASWQSLLYTAPANVIQVVFDKETEDSLRINVGYNTMFAQTENVLMQKNFSKQDIDMLLVLLGTNSASCGLKQP